MSVYVLFSYSLQAWWFSGVCIRTAAQPLQIGEIVCIGSALAAAEMEPSSPISFGGKNKKQKANMRKSNFSFGTQQVSPFKEKGNFDGILLKFPGAK